MEDAPLPADALPAQHQPLAPQHAHQPTPSAAKPAPSAAEQPVPDEQSANQPSQNNVSSLASTQSQPVIMQPDVEHSAPAEPSPPLQPEQRPQSSEPPVASEPLSQPQATQHQQPIAASTAIPTSTQIITSSEMGNVSSAVAHASIPTATQIAAQTLTAATAAATAAVKEELPAFIATSGAYHHNPPDALKQQNTQSAPDPTFTEAAHIESAAILNNVIGDEAHSIITSAPQTHQRLVAQETSGNMLQSFQEASDAAPIPPTDPSQQPMHAAPENFNQQTDPALREEPQHTSAPFETNQPQAQPPHQMHIETTHAGQANQSYPPAVVQPHPPIAIPTPQIHIPTRITNPVVSAALNGTLPKKPARMPGTKQCPACHSTIAAALAKCVKCPHVFREKKEKVKRSGKRGKKNCPKCNFENPSACSSCKKCNHIFRLKLIEKYKQMRPRATGATSSAAMAVRAQTVTASLGLPQVQSSNAPAVSTVPLPAGVASFPGSITPAIHASHAVSVIPPFSQHQITIHPHTHNVHSTGVSQVHPIPQHPVQQHQPHQQL
ncbi:hypothetical protein FGB62_2g340 [Gracilaria domingensis]|nr:hypothetical protein FGB62_2g340 [Gracilaria domingensis]